MNDNEYILMEIATAERDHNPTYKISVKFFGWKHDSKHISLTTEQLQKIKEVFKNEN